jgi:hypothetical protein
MRTMSVKSAGLPHGRFDDGRHTAITTLAEKGLPERVIQMLVGHVAPEMTRRSQMPPVQLGPNHTVLLAEERDDVAHTHLPSARLHRHVLNRCRRVRDRASH